MDDSQNTLRPQAAWSWSNNIPTDSSATGAEPVSQSPSVEGPRSRSHPHPRPGNGFPEVDARTYAREPEPEPEPQPPPRQQPQQQQQNHQQPRQRHYPPRTCRICLESVPPTFDVDTGAAGALFGSRPRVRYVSEDPELGRLMSPCRCKGSQRYVHEGCLQAWRQAAPLSDRNFWSCPTCGFRYRMARLRWAAWLSSRMTRVVLTLLVLLVAVFVLGFMADPIINLWVDPWGSFLGAVSDVVDDFEDLRTNLEDEEPFTWSLHFLKGVLSLGLVGAVQAFFAMSPWQWWHLRTGGYIGGGNNRRGGGRDRLENINLALVIVGLFTVLVGTWKLVSELSARALEKFSERVMDIQGEDDDDDADDDADRGDED